ncbi:MAG TPA: CRISPR-associated endonuclease Cas2 [Candidatus Limnocylindrales bacterium]|nr:CRISPR-associated endonuclease Cas2 [Candidatus Limnocylindrales bacterium]
MFIIVSYDVRENKRRTQIHKVLKSYGEWVQYSVFECQLEKKDYLRLRDRLDRLIDKEKGDNIRFYFLCDRCTGQVERIGGRMPLEDGAVFV